MAHEIHAVVMLALGLRRVEAALHRTVVIGRNDASAMVALSMVGLSVSISLVMAAVLPSCAMMMTGVMMTSVGGGSDRQREDKAKRLRHGHEPREPMPS